MKHARETILALAPEGFNICLYVKFKYDVKAQLPIHVVLSSGDYAQIKTDTRPRVEKVNQ